MYLFLQKNSYKAEMTLNEDMRKLIRLYSTLLATLYGYGRTISDPAITFHEQRLKNYLL